MRYHTETKVIALAVGGLLLSASPLMAQTTYNSQAVTTVAGTAATTVIPVSTTLPTAAAVSTTTGTTAVVVVPANSKVTVGQDTAGNVLTAIPAGDNVQIVAGNTAPTINTATTATGTTASVTVPVANKGTVTVTPSATSDIVVVQSTSTTQPASVTIGSSTAPVSLQSATTSTPLVLVGTNSSTKTVSVSAGAVTVGGGTLTAPSVTVSAGTLNTGTAAAPGTVAITSATGLAVSSGATLGGSGTISGSNGASVQVAGVLKPGNSPGILTVQNAAITMATTGTLQIDIDGATAGNGAGFASQVLGTGTSAFTASGALKPAMAGDVTYSAGEAASTGYKNPKVGTGYTIVSLTGTGTVGGAFTSLTPGAATTANMLSGTSFTAVYNAQSIVLYVTPTKFQNLTSSGISLSSNQAASATALQSLSDATNPSRVGRIADADLKSLFDNVAQQSAGNLQVAYDQIAGGDIATLATASLRTADLITNAFTSRASHGRTLAQTGIAGKGGISGGDIDGGAQGNRRWAAWVQPIGQIGDASSDNNGPGYSRTSVGALTGLEAQVGGGSVGLGYGYVRDNLEFDQFGNKANVDNHVLSLYGEYAPGNAFVNGSLGYTWKNFEETRNINIGSYAKTATGKTDGGNFSVATNFGYTFTPSSFIVEPSLGLRYNSFHLDGFTETGATSLNLKVNGQDFDSLQSVLGVRIAKPMVLESGLKIVPEVRVGWQHELLDNNSTITSKFTSGTASFSVNGTQPGTDAALIGVGVKAQLTGQLDIFADYNGRISTSETDHGLTAGVKYKF